MDEFEGGPEVEAVSAAGCGEHVWRLHPCSDEWECGWLVCPRCRCIVDTATLAFAILPPDIRGVTEA